MPTSLSASGHARYFGPKRGGLPWRWPGGGRPLPARTAQGCRQGDTDSPAPFTGAVSMCLSLCVCVHWVSLCVCFLLGHVLSYLSYLFGIARTFFCFWTRRTLSCRWVESLRSAYARTSRCDPSMHAPARSCISPPSCTTSASGPARPCTPRLASISHSHHSASRSIVRNILDPFLSISTVSVCRWTASTCGPTPTVRRVREGGCRSRSAWRPSSATRWTCICRTPPSTRRCCPLGW